MPPHGNSEAKLARARTHLQTLEKLVEDFADDAYRLEMTPDLWETAVPPAKGEIIIRAEATRQPPPELFGPVIGDVVHGLRSALDQLIWDLSVASQTFPPPPDPIPNGNPWRRVSFPICTTEASWNQAVARELWALDTSMHARLRSEQPFATDVGAPERAPLSLLHELWNIDKHRHLHLVNATVELHDVLSVKPFPDAPEVDFEVVSKRPAGTLVGKVELGRARMIDRPGRFIRMNLPQMHMNPRILIDVAFDAGAPAFGAVVIQLLGQLERKVTALVGAF